MDRWRHPPPRRERNRGGQSVDAAADGAFHSAGGKEEMETIHFLPLPQVWVFFPENIVACRGGGVEGGTASADL